MSVFAEVVVILLRYLRAIGSASGRSLVRFSTGDDGPLRKYSCERQHEIYATPSYSQGEAQSTGDPAKTLSHGFDRCVQDESMIPNPGSDLEGQGRTRKVSSFWRRIPRKSS